MTPHACPTVMSLPVGAGAQRARSEQRCHSASERFEVTESDATGNRLPKSVRVYYNK
jgi:hypothetical protein